MLTLNLATETWKDHAVHALGEVTNDLTDSQIESATEHLRSGVTGRLVADLVRYEVAHTQRVGNGSVVQDGTPEERDAFDSALAAESKSLREAVASGKIELL